MNNINKKLIILPVISAFVLFPALIPFKTNADYIVESGVTFNPNNTNTNYYNNNQNNTNQNYYNNNNQNYSSNNGYSNSGPIWYNNPNPNQNNNSVNNTNTTNNTTKTVATTKTVKKATTTTADKKAASDKSTSELNNLGANALWGSDTFMPSGFAQWFFFIVLLVLAIILWRKLYINSKERNAPLKHA